jgi:glycosyltransferase involved in cell wall biosynthesis
MDVRPLVFIDVSSFSGGIKRIFSILKRGKSHGINYIVVFNKKDYVNAVRFFPSFNNVMGQYRFYMLNWPKIYGNPLPIRYKNIFELATTAAKIAEKENVDLIVSPSETYSKFLLSYLTGVLSNRPWTSIFQASLIGIYFPNNLKTLFDFNIMLRHPYSSFERLWTFFTQLKISEKTLLLTVSSVVRDELKMLNNRIKVHIIEPGCGVDICNDDRDIMVEKYDAVFSARLIPEKGFLDIPEIWHFVVKEKPNAKLIVLGMVEDKKWTDEFYRLIKKYKLENNILLLGQKHGKKLVQLIKSSKLLIYPSILDSFGLSVLESLAYGKPVIAYDIPAIQSNYKECKAVKTVRIKDKQGMANIVLSMLESEAYMSELSYNAKLFAQKYNWDKVVEAEREAYIKVVDYFSANK